jgi:hypothetical protein
MNISTSRRTMIIRLINTFGYVIIFFGTLFFVQWATTSINVFFSIPLVQEQPGILNLILCTIPYPFTSGYLIAFLSTTSQIHYHFWIGIFCGVGLLIIMIWWIFKRSVLSLNRITTARGAVMRKYLHSEVTEEIPVKLKIRGEVVAHFIKDLTITSRSIKVFLSVVTPIIISFVFTYTFNFTVLGGQTPLNTDLIYNWSVILALQPIICGMLLYNLLNIEGSGTPLFTSLPINPNKQAKAKLLYLLIIQTISVVSPYLIYIFQPGFIDLFFTILAILPYSWFVLFSMFQMHVLFFGRSKYRFVLEPVQPQNRMIKTAFIYIVQYILYIIIISISIVSNFYGIQLVLSNLGVTLIIFYTILFFSFKTMFPTKSKLKKDGNFDSSPIPILSNWIKQHPWFTIIILMLLNFTIIFSGNSTLQLLSEMPQFIRFQIFYWYMILPTLLIVLIRTNLIPRSDETLYFKLKFPKTKIIKWAIVTSIFILFYSLFFVYVFSIPFPPDRTETLEISFYGILASLIFAIWNEFLFRGIFFSLLRSNYKRSISLWLSIYIFLISILVYNILLATILGIVIPILDSVYIIGVNIFLTYQYSRHENMFPALLGHFISTLLGAFPLFYFGMYTFSS